MLPWCSIQIYRFAAFLTNRFFGFYFQTSAFEIAVSFSFFNDEARSGVSSAPRSSLFYISAPCSELFRRQRSALRRSLALHALAYFSICALRSDLFFDSFLRSSFSFINFRRLLSLKRSQHYPSRPSLSSPWSRIKKTL